MPRLNAIPRPLPRHRMIRRRRLSVSKTVTVDVFRGSTESAPPQPPPPAGTPLRDSDQAASGYPYPKQSLLVRSEALPIPRIQRRRRCRIRRTLTRLQVSLTLRRRVNRPTIRPPARRRLERPPPLKLRRQTPIRRAPIPIRNNRSSIFSRISPPRSNLRARAPRHRKAEIHRAVCNVESHSPPV